MALFAPLPTFPGQMTFPSPSSLSADFRSFLLEAQNPDGGWGYGRASLSAAEPTCWSVLALRGTTEARGAVRSATQWLLGAQLPDGAWPAVAGARTGAWVTALACLALGGREGGRDAERRGVRWLRDEWPGEGGLWWRLRARLRPGPVVTSQDPSLRGWSWSPGTASWVEPTALALLALGQSAEAKSDGQVARRIELGERMLYDRMCPGGGWNSGNPSVYGVEGIPRVLPTVWALLALRAHAGRAENQRSLAWLAHAYPGIRGPASLALAHLCLVSYGREVPGLETALWSLYLQNRFFRQVHVTAWALMALEGKGLAGHDEA